MNYRTLGRTGLAVSEIGFGCGGTAGLMTGEDAQLQRQTVAVALNRGINYFDTAAAYGGGRSEENLGRVLEELGAHPIVATKVTLAWEDLRDVPAAVTRSIEGSLGRLRRDRLDVVHLHNRIGPARAARSPVGSGALLSFEDIAGPGGVFDTLDSLRRGGCIGAIGCCGFGGDPTGLARLIDLESFASMLVNYSLLNPSAWQASGEAGPRLDHAGIAARAAARGMGVVALRILEGGLLHDRVELAVRYVLSNPAVSTALVGFSGIAQVEEAVACADAGPLPPETLARIAATGGGVAARGGGPGDGIQ